MTYDCFTFFNEMDLLEIRFAILDKKVDYFLVVEATKTFSGLPKPLYYEENKARYAKWAHKIVHRVITDTPDEATDTHCDQKLLAITNASDLLPEGNPNWFREFYQKECIKKFLDELKPKDDDMCFVSDLDEIWDPETVLPKTDDIFKLRQKMYVYYLNNRSDEPWAGILATKYKNIKNAVLTELRSVKKTKYTYVSDGGWHFTYMGGEDMVKKKIESYGHQEFNTKRIKAKIEDRIKKNQDFIGRPFTFWVDDTELPKYLLDNKDKYPKLFKA